MHSVNLDLLHALAAHHPDGRPTDQHAHHRAELVALARGARHIVWRERLTRWRALLFGHGANEPPARLCQDQSL